MAKKPAAAKAPKKKRQPRAKAPAAVAAPAAAATPFNAISGAKLQRLVKDKLAVKRNVSQQFTGPLSQRIKDAVDKDKLDRPIYNLICSLWELDDVTLSHKLANLYYYLDASGLEARANNAPQLDLAGGGEKEEDGEEGEDGDGSLDPASAADAEKARQLHS